MKLVSLVLFASFASAVAVGGETLKRSKSLRFDGRSVEAVRPGRFDSFTHLSDGDDAAQRKKLYELPRDFSNRVADETLEMGYRK